MKNLYLALKAWIRYRLGIMKDGQQPDISVITSNTSDTERSRSVRVTQLHFNDFRKMHPWMTDDKPFHPKNHEEYVDKHLPFEQDGVIYLPVRYRPREFVDAMGETIEIPVARSVLFSREAYMYGYFEAKLMLPIAEGRWDAFWLTGRDTWPPEADIIESYSKNDMYKSFRRLQSNLHYFRRGRKAMLGAKNHPLPTAFKDKWIRFGLWWEKNFIRIYYNGYLVREITNKKILEQFNQPMHLIISSGIELKHYKVDNGPMFMAKEVKITTIFTHQAAFGFQPITKAN